MEDEAVVDENSGRVKVRLTLYHEVSSSVQDYGKRAYLSVPLKQYMTEGVRGWMSGLGFILIPAVLRLMFLDEAGLRVEEG